MRDPFSRLSTWYFSKKSLPYWGIILLDCCLILFSGLLVYTLNNGVLSTLDILGHLLVTLLVCLIPYLVGFRLFHTYSGIIRYSSFVDLQKVGFAVLFGLICVVVFQALTDFSPYLMYIRKRDLILSALLAMSLMWMMRVFVKFFYVSTFRVAKAERAFIYGVKQGGVSLAKSIQNQDPARFVLAGFISDIAEIEYRYLMGVKVYPNDEELVSVMRRKRSNVLLVSPLKVEAIRNNQEMVDRLIKANIKIYMTPAAQEWDGKSDLNHTQLREVNIEDLLPRDKIEIDLECRFRKIRLGSFRQIPTTDRTRSMLSWRTFRRCSRSGCLCNPHPCHFAARHRSYHQPIQRFYPTARPGNSFLTCRASCRKCIEGSEFLKQSSKSEESKSPVIIQPSRPCTVSTLFPERCRFYLYFRGKRRTRRGTPFHRQSGDFLPASQCG